MLQKKLYKKTYDILIVRTINSASQSQLINKQQNNS